MARHFTIAAETAMDAQSWGTSRWISHPPSTGSERITVIHGSFRPGEGHAFHRHPGQEEVIVVLSGTVEQWVGREKRILGPGDSAFIPDDMVHASYNVGDGEARLLAIFSPSIGEFGVTAVEVADEAPWRDLRG
jgi:quercetin dioxygenase-like cupin family protein